MNRWAARMMGLLLLLVFALMFVQMHRTLVALQRAHAPAASPSR
jgi:hypothetical protein